jgi:hypothetical protein
MEWWILAGVVIALAAAGGAARLCRSYRTRREKETDSIYPLW